MTESGNFVSDTGEGAERVRADTVLDPERLARALAALPEPARGELLRGLDALADAAERLS